MGGGSWGKPRYGRWDLVASKSEWRGVGNGHLGRRQRRQSLERNLAGAPSLRSGLRRYLASSSRASRDFPLTRPVRSDNRQSRERELADGQLFRGLDDPRLLAAVAQRSTNLQKPAVGL